MFCAVQEEAQTMLCVVCRCFPKNRGEFKACVVQLLHRVGPFLSWAICNRKGNPRKLSLNVAKKRLGDKAWLLEIPDAGQGWPRVGLKGQVPLSEAGW